MKGKGGYVSQWRGNPFLCTWLAGFVSLRQLLLVHRHIPISQTYGRPERNSRETNLSNVKNERDVVLVLLLATGRNTPYNCGLLLGKTADHDNLSK